MPSSTPAITVMMPVYNDGRFLRAAVASILAQSFANFELLVVDDGSTDDTPAVLASFADARLRILRNPANRGLTFSLNLGIAQARGPLIARMDADDVAEPQRLARQVEFLARNPEVGVLGTSRTLIDERDGYVATAPAVQDDLAIRWKCLLGNPFAHPTVMFRRSLLVEQGLRYRDVHRAEDYDLWPRLLLHTRGANLPESLLRYRLRTRPPASVASQLASHDQISVNAMRTLLGASVIGEDEVRELRGRFGGFSVRDPSMDPADPKWVGAYLNLLKHFEAAHAHRPDVHAYAAAVRATFASRTAA